MSVLSIAACLWLCEKSCMVRVVITMVHGWWR